MYASFIGMRRPSKNPCLFVVRKMTLKFRYRDKSEEDEI